MKVDTEGVQQLPSLNGVQLQLAFTRRDKVSSEYLETAAEHVLDTLIERAQFVAWGPSVSANFASSTIEVECTVAEHQLDASRERIEGVVREALAECDYELEASASDPEAVPAGV